MWREPLARNQLNSGSLHVGGGFYRISLSLASSDRVDFYIDLGKQQVDYLFGGPSTAASVVPVVSLSDMSESDPSRNLIPFH